MTDHFLYWVLMNSEVVATAPANHVAMTRFWQWVVSNPEFATIILQQVVFAGASAVCQTMGWTRASKVFGTLTSLDIGRVLRSRDRSKDSSTTKGDAP